MIPLALVEQVAEDDFKPVDPADILPESVQNDFAAELLSDFFPGGKVEEAPPAPSTKSSPKK